MAMISELQKPLSSGFNAKSESSDVLKEIDLNGKIAVVTGGYSGIGFDTTKGLVSAGAEVIIPAKRIDIATQKAVQMMLTKIQSNILSSK